MRGVSAAPSPTAEGPPGCHDDSMNEPDPSRSPFAVPGALVLAGMVALGLTGVLVALAATARIYGTAG